MASKILSKMTDVRIVTPLAGFEDLLVRHVNEEDLSALEWGGEYAHFRRLYRDAFQRSVRGLSILWVADLPGSGIIGQVFVQLNCDRPELCNGIDRAYLYAFRVKEEFRGLGIGGYLLQTVEADLIRRRFLFATLNVARENYRAQAFYRRHGFRIVAPEAGRWSYVDHEGHIQEVNEPAWRMEKTLH